MYRGPAEAVRETPTEGTVIQLICGDITAWSGDVIVNAANPRMLGGGGVDGAIHHAAGPALYEACEAIPEVSPGIRCPTGEARITPAFGRLKCRFVIHTVGPIYQDPAISGRDLKSAYENSLRIASAHELKSIAFPAISCGVYSYPLEDAAAIALETCTAFESRFSRIEFVLFTAETLQVWERVWAQGSLG